MTPSTTSGTSTLGRLRWPIAAAAALVAALLIWQLAGGSDDGDPGQDPASTESPGTDATGEPIGPVESSAAVTLGEMGRSVTFHAVYEVTGSPAEDATGTLGFSAVGLWRGGGWTRQDVVTQGPDGTTRVQAVRSPDGVAEICTLSADRMWRCIEQRADVDNDLFLTAAGQLATVEVEASDVTIAGHDGTCFTVADNESVQLCYRSDGVPLRLASETGEILEVTSITNEVDDEAFTTPEDGSTEPPDG